MKGVIEYSSADSWQEYQEIWASGMKHLHWFKEKKLFDYTREEMLLELEKDFEERKSNLFLKATYKETGEVLGVLGIKLFEKHAILRRWEPAVPVKQNIKLRYRIGLELLSKAQKECRRNGIEQISAMLRIQPKASPEQYVWHHKLYLRARYFLERKSVQLLAKLDKVKTPEKTVEGYTIETLEKNHSLDELAKVSLKAFAERKEDKLVHQKDPFVLDHEKTLRIFREIKAGKLGKNEPKNWQIALKNGEIVGFLISYYPKDNSRPSFGVIGQLGVLPEHRKKGIASALICKTCKLFKENHCKYSYVGTPEKDLAAIKLYQKYGHKIIFNNWHYKKNIPAKKL